MRRVPAALPDMPASSNDLAPTPGHHGTISADASAFRKMSNRLSLSTKCQPRVASAIRKLSRADGHRRGWNFCQVSTVKNGHGLSCGRRAMTTPTSPLLLA